MTRATVFIGDLSRFCSDEDILSLFLPFGKVIETKIMRNPVTGISLGYGFLIMGSTDSALLAMQYLQGVQLRGRPLSIKWAGRNIKNEVTKTIPHSPRDSTTAAVINSVHVRFQALHVSEQLSPFCPHLLCTRTLTFLSVLFLMFNFPSPSPLMLYINHSDDTS